MAVSCGQPAVLAREGSGADAVEEHDGQAVGAAQSEAAHAGRPIGQQRPRDRTGQRAGDAARRGGPQVTTSEVQRCEARDN
eukprot:15519919-Heterocapsa_arctica.AAC.1